VLIRVYGGCHITGYPYAQEFAFTQVAVSQLARSDLNAQLDLIDHVSLKRRREIIDSSSELLPHIVVLQLAHYETAYPLPKLVGKATRVQISLRP
jgi:hypothetical protein